MNTSPSEMTLECAIGAAVLESAKAEDMLLGVLTGLRGSFENVGRDQELTLFQTINECKKLLESQGNLDPKASTEISILLEELDELRDKRNQVIHDIAARDQSSSENEFVWMPSIWATPSSHDPFDISDVIKLTQDFRQAWTRIIAVAIQCFPVLAKPRYWENGDT
ncbi:hypothetical protein [Salininema proteolyticum]|uniref:Uncharacterized protein n=1 Tax=Salininema proteolyticum TaxID=1607685 RepID=A0ABV8TT59_9ACTN